eukprot:TRINITY_DN13385_c1_g1_i1.p2 TRINITY_DN13385_c1_g1~~TRINITY_DN13385_c1_g1_i1.p2  ORF type:complete len:402 (+),score=35.67 TRINITY_DN13385_c1_g1_i1:80-1285(+)
MTNDINGIYKVERAAEILKAAVKKQPNNMQLLGQYAKLLKALNRCQEASDVYCQLSKLQQLNENDKHSALYSQAQCLRCAGSYEEAAKTYMQYLELYPKDERAQFWLAVVAGSCSQDNNQQQHQQQQQCKLIPRCPKIVVSQLFDAYADTFDEHLTQRLQYHTPQAMQQILQKYVQQTSVDKWKKCVDLGCGTGLMGPILRQFVEILIGIDLSQGMLNKARQRGCYDFVFLDDVTNFLEQCKLQVDLLRSTSDNGKELETGASSCSSHLFDLLVAADVVVYLGNLHPLLQSARAASRVGSVFIFSTELLSLHCDLNYNDRTTGNTDDDSGHQVSYLNYQLQRTGRYSHSESYVCKCAQNCGWNVISVDNAIIRHNKDAPVEGQIFVLEASQSDDECVINSS